MGTEPSAPILLYLASEDRAFVSHRLPMARAAQAAGYVVHVATNVTAFGDAISAEGFTLHSIPFQRGGLSLVRALGSILAIRRIERRIKPDVIHHSGLQCCVLGGIAALGTTTRQVNALTGLGYAFTSHTIKSRALKFAVTIMLKRLLNRSNSIVLVQNPDDRAALEAIGISKKNIALIPGSGVDIKMLQPLTEPDGPITVGFAGRLLVDKGIRTVVNAHRLLRKHDVEIHLLIAGEPDPANPASVTQLEAEAWAKETGITWLGQVTDIAELWRRSHIAILPSYREGLPKALLEAAACGRPMVATDVPGCREIVLDDRTGILIPVEDQDALADAIKKLATSKELRARYGAAARKLVVEKLSEEAIGHAIVQLYRT